MTQCINFILTQVGKIIWTHFIIFLFYNFVCLIFPKSHEMLCYALSLLVPLIVFIMEEQQQQKTA